MSEDEPINPFSLLPIEILHLILSRLPAKDLSQVVLSCRCLATSAQLQLRLLFILKDPALSTLCCPPDCDEETCPTEGEMRTRGRDPINLLIALASELDNTDQLVRCSSTRPPDLVRFLDRSRVDSWDLVFGNEPDFQDDESLVEGAEPEQLDSSDDEALALPTVISRLESILETPQWSFEDDEYPYVVSLMNDFLSEVTNFVAIINAFAGSVHRDILDILGRFGGVEAEYIEEAKAEIIQIEAQRPRHTEQTFLAQETARAAGYLVCRALFLRNAVSSDYYGYHADMLVDSLATGNLVTSVMALLSSFQTDDKHVALMLPPALTDSRQTRHTLLEILSGMVVDIKLLTWQGRLRMFLSKKRFDELNKEGPDNPAELL